MGIKLAKKILHVYNVKTPRELAHKLFVNIKELYFNIDPKFFQGYCDMKNRTIYINVNLPENQKNKLILHEIYHIIKSEKYHSRKANMFAKTYWKGVQI